QREVDELHRNNVRLVFVGDLESLQEGLRDGIKVAEAKTNANTGLQLQVAVAYGGRWDIVHAARSLAKRTADGEINAEDIDDERFAAELALGDVPDPDLLIRTGGEQRISNFLLWNLAYAELWFCETLWPDFDAADFDAALNFFARRERRYGHTGEQVEAISP
ncbi:MAG: di-trans,poly-cis-decaprenylcistransferase, partial [Gammaproteobacteria bacterium]|nr:di-trans,poly-cis-decaprenylcistransferase [Gammaproteobacteria bacterium]